LAAVLTARGHRYQPRLIDSLQGDSNTRKVAIITIGTRNFLA
jgi:hypothetical protein